jgi:DNA invertase Pin-like site-specific DNA recombinase
MRGYAKKRSWKIMLKVKEVGSGAKTRPQREELLKAARRREVNVMIVWRHDRWGRSLADLVTTLKEHSDLGIGFVSLT